MFGAACPPAACLVPCPLAQVKGGSWNGSLSGCWGAAGGPGCCEALGARDAGGRSVALIALGGTLCQLSGSQLVTCQVHDFREIEGRVTLCPGGVCGSRQAVRLFSE